jgi:hypothetical protein
MRNIFFKITAVLSLLFLISSNLPAQDAYNLQYKFTKDNTYQYHIDMSSNITQEAMGKEMKFGSDVIGVMSFHVDDVAGNGDMQLTSSMDSALVKSNLMGKDTTINLTAIIGKRTKTVLTSLGEIKSCVMIDSVDENISRMMSATQEVKRFFTKFPGKDIKIGESWNSSNVDTVKMLGGAIISSNDIVCTLSGKEIKSGHECLKIPFTGKLKISGNANIQGMDFTMEGEGTSSGMLFFDSKTGLLIHMDGAIDNDMTMATKGQQNMVIPITTNVKYSEYLK